MRALLLANSTCADGLGPLGRALASSDALADEYVGEILQTTGRCGPIAETLAFLGAKFVVAAGHLLQDANPDTKMGRQRLSLGKSCAETARLNLAEAMKVSILTTQLRPPERVDPTDAHLPAAATFFEDDTE